MQNKNHPAGNVAILAIIIALAVSCSSVFTSSINGSIIDAEQYATDGTVTGVADAKVFLYIDKAARDAALAAYVEGNESTLPDSDANTEVDYFQSTVSDADGAYQFSGFLWSTFFPKFGKTADRREIYLLIYHKDYGVWKNPVPLFVVSDVTAQLDRIKITNLWNDGRMTGRVVDWKDGKGLGGVAVNFYVAKSWSSYDEATGTFPDVKFPANPTTTVNTDADGYWTANLRFAVQPTRALDTKKAPIKITFTQANYRLNSPVAYTGFSNPATLVLNEDLNRNGRTASDDIANDSTPSNNDWADAYLPAIVVLKDDLSPVPEIADVMMQRWRFTANVSGRIYSDFDDDGDGATANPTPPVKKYENALEVSLTVPNTATGIVFKDISNSQTVGETTTDGHVNLGAIEWFIADLADLSSPVDSALDEQKSGKVGMAVTVAGATLVAPLPVTQMEPDVDLTLDLKVTVP